MPFATTSPVFERVRFVQLYQSGDFTKAELCRRFGVSRETAYKWLRRFEAEGLDGLYDRSRAANAHPHAMPEDVAERVLAVRRAHPTWGPRKIVAWLEERFPDRDWPAPSSCGDLLKRNGLVLPRKRRLRPQPAAKPYLGYDAPNAVWCADFKGKFRTRDGIYCHPLTISDGYSRFLLRCTALAQPTDEAVRRVFLGVFKQYGLPQAIRTDNGTPFAGVGLGGLTKLSVWWAKLGIRLERIEPGKPQQNGRHERMHRTLKLETAFPPHAHHAAQQRAFDRFRREYNQERPHEALGQKPPTRFYQPSSKPLPACLEPPAYAPWFERRMVNGVGQMKWRGHAVFISEALVGEPIGLEPIADGVWHVHFGPMLLAEFDESRRSVKPLVANIQCAQRKAV